MASLRTLTCHWCNTQFLHTQCVAWRFILFCVLRDTCLFQFRSHHLCFIKALQFIPAPSFTLENDSETSGTCGKAAVMLVFVLGGVSLLRYLLFINFECFFHIRDLRGANWQSLDFTGSQCTQVTNRFNVSGTNKLPKTSRPMRKIEGKMSLGYFGQRLTENKYLTKIFLWWTPCCPHHMLEEIWGSTASTGVEQPTRAG